MAVNVAVAAAQIISALALAFAILGMIRIDRSLKRMIEHNNKLNQAREDFQQHVLDFMQAQNIINHAMGVSDSLLESISRSIGDLQSGKFN